MESSDEPVEVSSPPKPKYIVELSDEAKKSFLNSFDVVFSDCDGVIWHTMQQEAIPGAANGIEYLREQGKKVVFVTNNSLRPIEGQLDKFREHGLTVEKEDIFHPARNIAEFLLEQKVEGLVYVCAAQPLKDVLKEAGFDVVDGPNRLLEETFQDLAENIFTPQPEPIKAVVIDVDYNLSVSKLMRAHLYLKNPECLFIGGAADTVIPFGTAEIIGPGPFITVLEITSKRKATILGKPGTALCDMLKTRFNLTEPQRALFVGDSLNSDVSFGKKCGFQTLAVLSGGTKRDDLDKKEEELIGELPDYYAASLADFIGLS